MEDVGGNYIKPFSPLDEKGSDHVRFAIVPDFVSFLSAIKTRLVYQVLRDCKTWLRIVTASATSDQADSRSQG
jgi:hypothetical protein